MKILAAIFSVAAIAIAGIFSFVLGLFIAHPVGLSDFSSATLWFLIGAGGALFLLKYSLGCVLLDLTPLFIFLLGCVVSGFLVDIVSIPDGYKLIGLAVALFSSGLFSVKQISRKIGRQGRR